MGVFTLANTTSERLRDLLLAAVVLLGASCVPPEPLKPLRIEAKFNDSEVAFFKQKGVSEIRGQAFLRQVGGGVVKASGERVFLYPFHSYFVQKVLYQELAEFREDIGFPSPIEGLSPRENEFTKTVVADADGRFRFEGLSPGQYLVATRVVWYIPRYRGGRDRQGGGFGKK